MAASDRQRERCVPPPIVLTATRPASVPTGSRGARLYARGLPGKQPYVLSRRSLRLLSFPRPRPLRPCRFTFAQPCIHACVYFDQSAEQPDRIGESIQIGKNLRLNLNSTRRQSNRITLCPATDRTRNIVRGSLSVRSGQRPV